MGANRPETCLTCGMPPSAGRHANFTYCDNPCHATPPARDDAVEEARDAERFRWLMSRNFGFAFDAEKCGISTGRWGKWPEEADAQRAMIDRAIAHYAALRREKGGA